MEAVERAMKEVAKEDVRVVQERMMNGKSF